MLVRPGKRVRLPAEPTPGQLKGILRASAGGAFFDEASEDFGDSAYIHTYMSLGDAFNGVPLAPDALRMAMRKLDWQETFKKLARLAAILANRGGPFSKQLDAYAAALLAGHWTVHPVEGAIVDYVRKWRGRRAIFHEKVIYFLQALALIDGGTEGTSPSDAHLAFLGLAANDYVDDWFADDDRALEAGEDIVAAVADAARFNQQNDLLRTITRCAAILQNRPPRGSALSDSGIWDELERAAFGGSFREFFLSFVMPLVFQSRSEWGKTSAAGLVVNPALAKRCWSAKTTVAQDAAEEFLASLTLSRRDAKSEITRRSNGLPRAPTILLKKPLVDVEDELWAASPSAVQNQLHSGLWARLRRAAKAIGVEKDWFPAFGLMFESWCQQVAAWSASSASFGGSIHLPSSPGARDEIEDVVVYDDRAVVLFSIKATLVREDAAYGAEKRTATWDWYRKQLFRGRTRGDRPGWAWQLDQKIERLRQGEYEAVLSSGLDVFPVIVMYDHTAESAPLYDLIDRELAELALLQQPRVAPLALCSARTYEALMGMAAHGYRVSEVLREKAAPRWRRQRLETLIYEYAKMHRGADFRIPQMAAEFDRLADEARRRLFGSSLGDA